MESIKVYVRVRPLLEQERGQRSCVKSISRDTISVEGAKSRLICQFDRTFSEGDNQSAVFGEFQDVLDCFLEGFNATIFAYGQTGSGKTYTLIGSDPQFSLSAPSSITSWEFSNRVGLIPRLCSALFSKSLSPNTSLYCSVLQIYNDSIYDLLSDSPVAETALQIHEDSANGIHVPGLMEFKVNHVRDCLTLIARASAIRATRETVMNQQSSRSHLVFQLLMESTSEEGRIRRSKLNLVDLAGSEKWITSGEVSITDEHISELTYINKSLSTLSRCIHALAAGENHIPYRESKLTRLLQDSLGGNTKTRVIATIGPAVQSAPETISTMKFADSAKRVMHIVKVNEARSVDRVAIVKLEREISALRETVQRLHAENEQLRRRASSQAPYATGDHGGDDRLSGRASEESAPGAVPPTLVLPRKFEDELQELCAPFLRSEDELSRFQSLLRELCERYASVPASLGVISNVSLHGDPLLLQSHDSQRLAPSFLPVFSDSSASRSVKRSSAHSDAGMPLRLQEVRTRGRTAPQAVVLSHSTKCPLAQVPVARKPILQEKLLQQKEMIAVRPAPPPPLSQKWREMKEEAERAKREERELEVQRIQEHSRQTERKRMLRNLELKERIRQERERQQQGRRTEDDPERTLSGEEDSDLQRLCESSLPEVRALRSGEKSAFGSDEARGGDRLRDEDEDEYGFGQWEGEGPLLPSRPSPIDPIPLPVQFSGSQSLAKLYFR